MNFFGIGHWELALVIIIGVIVLGPERIPGVAVQLARAVRYLRGYATDATADIRRELEELTKEYDEMRKEFREFQSSARKDVSSLTEEIDRTLKETGPIIEPGGEPPPRTARSSSDKRS